MVELTANGQAFELPLKGNEIKYTKQIADIFDLASVASSYTNSFDIPKNPHNTQIMAQLGIVGDTSTIPYEKIPSSLKKHGFPIFQNGWLSVKETTDSYKVSVIDGMIDFFKAIENKTMGADLDLSNFNHTKDIDSVIASFTNEYYKYIIADYNGKNLGIFDETVGINVDYLVPCFNMGALFELVMTTFGFNFDATNIMEIVDLYITYPKSPEEDVTDELVGEFEKGLYVKTPTSIGGGYSGVPSQRFWDDYDYSQGLLIDTWRYQLDESTGYIFDLSVEAYGLYKRYFETQQLGNITIPGFWGWDQFRPMTVEILINGLSIASVQTDPLAAVTINLSEYHNAGDIVEVKMYAPTQWLSFYIREVHHKITSFKVYKTNQGTVSLSDAFKDFQIKDFIKEVFWRTAVTPVIDKATNTMSFISVDERLDFNRAIDWSDKFIRRTKEQYINGSYAQKNAFKHKYNDEDDISQNGYLLVNNRNIEAEKTIVQSKIYAPENFNTIFEDTTLDESVTTKKFTVWSRETKENEDGELEIEYKGLNGRFYIMKFNLSPESTWRFVSEKIAGSATVSQFPYANTIGTTFDQIVPVKYAKYPWLLDGFKSHEIELALSVLDILEIDMTRPYYFSQEAQCYILNKLNFQEGSEASGEFVRINRAIGITMELPEPDPEPVPQQYCINWQANNFDNIKMSLEGEMDFEEILNGRIIHPLSVGTVTEYIINGGTVTTSPVSMTFSATKGFINTDSLPVVTDKVLTSITVDIQIICTNASEINITATYAASESDGQTFAEYNNCLCRNRRIQLIPDP